MGSQETIGVTLGSHTGDSLRVGGEIRSILGNFDLPELLLCKRVVQTEAGCELLAGPQPLPPFEPSSSSPSSLTLAFALTVL